MAKKMNKVRKAIIVTKINAIRGFCRLEAKHYKARGYIEDVKTWNDLAYRGDVLFQKAMNV